MMLNAGNTQGCGEMRFAGTRATDQDQILCGIGKCQRGQLLNQRSINLGLCEIKAQQIPVDGVVTT
jgi:hypothetical protein